MSQVVTNAGEALFAQKAQANEQLDIDTFIFAYVPGQDSQAPVDRSEDLPPTAQRVHTQPVQQVGRINNNTVVYSTVLNSLTGPFEFNWVGLYSSVNNTLVAISHVKSVNKTITELGNAGNTLNRNFAIEYSGISDITGITVAPETWQLDFSARLAGMDALTQNLAMDMNGRDWFIGDGFKVEPTANDDEFRVIAGVGYVAGLRVELKSDFIFTLDSYPKFVYLEAWLEGNSSSEWEPKLSIFNTTEQLSSFSDAQGSKHYLVKIAELLKQFADSIIDLREIDGLVGKTIRNADTVHEMKAMNVPLGTLIKTKGYNNKGDGFGASYLIEDIGSKPVNGRTVILLNNGFIAVMQHNGSSSIQHANAPLDDDANIGLAIHTLLAVGVKTIYVPNAKIRFNGSINLNGATVIGNNSVYASGYLTNGNLVGITRESLTNKFVKPVSKVQPVTSKSKNKLVVKVDRTPNNVTSVYNSIHCILSPSSFGGIAMFFLGNGSGANGENDMGGTFDRLRLWNSYLAEGGIVYQTPDSVTAGTNVTSYEYLNKIFNGGPAERWSATEGTELNAFDLSAGNSATFKIPASRRKSNIAVYTSSGSTDDATITVNGELIKTFSAKSDINRVKHIEFETPIIGRSENTVVISSGSARLYLFAADVYDLADIPKNEIDAYYKYKGKIIVHGMKSMTYAGTGASIDTVLVDTMGKFAGSYHGGDIATPGDCEIRVGSSQIKIDTSNYTEENDSLKLANGMFMIDPVVRVRYVGKIDTTPQLDFRYTLDFGVDGGCNLTAWYSANSGSVHLKTIFTGMHSTSRSLMYTPKHSFSPESTDGTIELDVNQLPLYQYGSKLQQMIIVPSENTEDQATILARIWDTDAYLKFYYTPLALQGDQSLSLQNGQQYSFSCLYQYGRFIV
ncbi:phage tail protein [Pseudoalteromonas sp. P1-7a]|uniref:phage tail-collar fiber domain-containing protein n=1 Tax=Pseudoalteromonas sp. P1-7a TaxID=1723755 RepID=UPI0006D67B06|nr:phage tail protein [Pseudoalteromonas sp. P1-7a]KPZ59513.1 Tail fiber protein [Pseudoalteromonas sp. P1-7a]